MLLPSIAVEAHGVHNVQPLHFPRIAMGEPVVRKLNLQQARLRKRQKTTSEVTQETKNKKRRVRKYIKKELVIAQDQKQLENLHALPRTCSPSLIFWWNIPYVYLSP